MTDETRILLVDDEPRNIRLLAAVLEANGLTVTSASSGHEVLERVRADDPDLVLLDIHMRVSDRVLSEVEELVDAEPAGAHVLKGFGFDLPVGTHSIVGRRSPANVRR